MAVLRTTALILRHTTDREHDRLLTILTPAGQHRVRARGTKKSVSKLGGSLEPLSEVDVNIADGRVVGLVTGSIILDRFDGLRSDVVGLTMGQWWLELIEAVTKPNQDAADVYGLALATLRGLQERRDQAVGRRWMYLCRQTLQLLIHEGFSPALDVCSVCHEPLGLDDMAYDPRQGFVHAHEAPTSALKLTPATVGYLRDHAEPSQERDVFAETHRLMELMIHHTLDRPLKSEMVLRAVIRQTRLPKRPAE